MEKLRTVLFAIGIVLCVSPFLIRAFARKEEKTYSCEYQEMGRLEIPKIEVDLPIYEGTGEEILKRGIGHLEGTSPLDGGQNSHCVLAGHRGLPSVKMLEDLGEVTTGDIFYIEVIGKKIKYRVCQIQVVRPERPKGLEIQEGRELVSLVTCTPYGINTHRLIVTGERMEVME